MLFPITVVVILCSCRSARKIPRNFVVLYLFQVAWKSVSGDVEFLTEISHSSKILPVRGHSEKLLVSLLVGNPTCRSKKILTVVHVWNRSALPWGLKEIAPFSHIVHSQWIRLFVRHIFLWPCVVIFVLFCLFQFVRFAERRNLWLGRTIRVANIRYNSCLALQLASEQATLYAHVSCPGYDGEGLSHPSYIRASSLLNLYWILLKAISVLCETEKPGRYSQINTTTEDLMPQEYSCNTPCPYEKWTQHLGVNPIPGTG